MVLKMMKHMAIVYPSGKFQKTSEEKILRIKELEQEGFAVTDLEPSLNAMHGITAGPVLERAALLSHALTNRKFDILMAGRGGYGVTELIAFLDDMLPPVLPPKTLVGFSDISYLGVYLTLRYPNFYYIHAKNAFSESLFLDENSEKTVLFNLLREKDFTPTFDTLDDGNENSRKLEDNEKNNIYSSEIKMQQGGSVFECSALSMNIEQITGICIPLNLSLAESLAATKGITLPIETILFLEECNEYVYRSLRKIDSLINSGFMDNVKAVVLGDFTKSLKQNEQEIDRKELLQIIAHKLNKPIIDFPLFGHGKHCFPLVARSRVFIKKSQNSDNAQNNIITLTLTHNIPKTNGINATTPSSEKGRTPLNLASDQRSADLGLDKAPQARADAVYSNIHKSARDAVATQYKPKSALRLHMCGVGGTGMASVAGLLKSAGYEISGSDNTIYPPMDKVLTDLHIIPDVGFKKENITKRSIDAIIMGNVMSRKTASLQKNEELEEILQNNIPIMSFPSALRKIFLHKSFNIVISGTHGKTTTSSLFTFVLQGVGSNPSFLIGGMPGNFGQGFGLNARDLFVLEGDEYDCAFFDKGPKFLHYEPSIALINNIEFDHADIYDSIDAIENEFLRLAELTRSNEGFNIVNWDDSRVRRIARKVQGHVIAFGNKKSLVPAVEPRDDSSLKLSSRGSTAGTHDACPFPMWVLDSFDTTRTGITIQFSAPNNAQYSISCAQIFGAHNALNLLGVLAGMHAKYLLCGKTLEDLLQNIPKIQKKLEGFKGIKRRFELLGCKNDIAVFDDFAHHPTAVRATLQAFRDYISFTKQEGRLIVCFDPHNATMRRNILQDDLAKSFAPADILFLGKIPKDLRMNQKHVLDGQKVVESCGIKAQYFDENVKLLDALKNEACSHDTIVFMSSGSFDGIAREFVNSLEKKGY